jgi:hypothetical protein
VVHLVEMTADGRRVDLEPRGATGAGEVERLQIRYTAIHLSAPERVRYSTSWRAGHGWVSGRERGA